MHPLCPTVTKSLYNYHSYKAKNRWRSVNTHFNAFFIQHLLPSIIVLIMFLTYWLCFYQIVTQRCGTAERSNIFALFALIPSKLIYLAKRVIEPAMHLFTNRYFQGCDHLSHIIYLKMELTVRLHKEAGETYCRILPYCFWITLFLLVSNVLTYTNTISACLYDFRVGWINSGIGFGALTSCCPGLSRLPMTLSRSKSDSTSALHLSSLPFG